MSLLIVDISSNNRMPDFKRMKAAGVRGVFIKATEGSTYRNPEFADAWRLANQAGLVVGSYHFARQDAHPLAATRDDALKALPLGKGYMGVSRVLEQAPPSKLDLIPDEQVASGAREEAQHYISVMRRLPNHGKRAWREGNFLPVLDFEVGTPDRRYSPWRDAFMAELGKVGHRSVLYTFPFFNVWAPPKRGQQYLWIADYSTAPKPRVPPHYPGWHLWQFTSSQAIPGAHEHLDASRLPRGGKLSTIRCQKDG